MGVIGSMRSKRAVLTASVALLLALGVVGSSSMDPTAPLGGEATVLTKSLSGMDSETEIVEF